MSAEYPQTPDEVRQAVRNEALEVSRSCFEYWSSVPPDSVESVVLDALSKAFEKFADGLER